MRSTDAVYFVYSEMQLKGDNDILKNLAKTMIPGKVSVGDTTSEFTKIIKTEDLDVMSQMYPDVQIILQSKYGDAKFTDIEVKAVSGN